ncbi:MAG: NYN domain-containing protein [Phormidesmis sp.]
MAAKPSQAILLVDAYNIIGAWPNLAQIKAEQGLDSARTELITALANYSAYQAYETWAVFDAYEQRSPASQETITPHLSVHYTGYGQTADSYIERACAKFRHDARKFTQRLIVATSDSVHRQTAIGYGAEGMSAMHLEGEIRSISHQAKTHQKPRKKRSGQFFTALTPEVQARLNKMRMGQQE